MTCELSAEAKRHKQREMRRKFFPIYITYFVCWAFYNFSHPAKDSLWAYLLAIGLSVSMIGMIVTLAVVTTKQKDEYQQLLLMQSMMWGIGGMLSVTTIWGLLESLTSVPHLPILMNFPIFLIIALTAKLMLFRSNRPVDE